MSVVSLRRMRTRACCQHYFPFVSFRGHASLIPQNTIYFIIATNATRKRNAVLKLFYKILSTWLYDSTIQTIKFLLHQWEPIGFMRYYNIKDSMEHIALFYIEFSLCKLTQRNNRKMRHCINLLRQACEVSLSFRYYGYFTFNISQNLRHIMRKSSVWTIWLHYNWNSSDILRIWADRSLHFCRTVKILLIEEEDSTENYNCSLHPRGEILKKIGNILEIEQKHVFQKSLWKSKNSRKHRIKSYQIRACKIPSQLHVTFVLLFVNHSCLAPIDNYIDYSNDLLNWARCSGFFETYYKVI